MKPKAMAYITRGLSRLMLIYRSKYYKFSIAFSLRALIIRSLHSSNPIFQV